MRNGWFIALLILLLLGFDACMPSADPEDDGETAVSPSPTVERIENILSTDVPSTPKPNAVIRPPSSPQIYCPDPEIDNMAGTLIINGNDSIYTNPVLGIKLTSPHKLCVHEPDYLFDSYGFTLSEPDTQDGSLLSVDWLYQATPEQLNTYVQQTIDSVPELEIVHETIMVNGIEGVALWPLPGTEATTQIYFVANERLYHLIFWSVPLDEQAQAMLDNLSFIEPTQTLDMLNLPEARP